MDSDWILILKMKQGNQAAWEQFVRKYYGDILKYCHFHCQEQSSSEDLTQETFLKFFSSLSQYHHIGKAKNYLYTIAANLCKNFNLEKKNVALDEVPDIFTEPISQIEDRLMLEKAMRDLPEELKNVIVLHYYQGLKLSEVAAVLKIGVPLVKYRIRRAKEQLRKETEYGCE